MIKIENPADCCGCTACASICPRNAIEMQPDILGFLYPAVNNELCINCGLCNDVCAFHSHYDTADNLSEPEIVAARHKNIDEVMKSRSGAMFVALSDYILDNGGIIYGPDMPSISGSYTKEHRQSMNVMYSEEANMSKVISLGYSAR